MIVYRLRVVVDAQPAFYLTLKDAQSAGRVHAGLMLNPEQGIEQIDLPVDKRNVIALLNNQDVGAVQRRWEFTSRGGLLEVDEEGNRVKNACSAILSSPLAAKADTRGVLDQSF